MKEEIFHVIHQESATSRKWSKSIVAHARGKSNEEIAQELGIAVSTVKSHKAKGYAVLREKLQYLKILLLLLSDISFFLTTFDYNKRKEYRQ